MKLWNLKAVLPLLTAGMLLIAQAAFAAEDAAQPAPFEPKFQTGKITVANGFVSLNVPERFGFLDSAQTRRVITELWGNPDTETEVLGMLAPTDIPLGARESWGVLVYYSDDGHVADDEAKSINYDELLKEMQGRVSESNEERVKAGYPSISLVGWAEPPHYDQATHKLYWAKHLKFGGDGGDTLNYSIRALGRQGVLELNVVASMSDLKTINNAVPQILSMVDFNEGQRYADYKPGVDKLAVYGIGALIAGQVAAKAGFFKLIIAGLIAMKKLVILLVIGLISMLKKFMGRGAEGPEQSGVAPPPPSSPADSPQS